ncbi:hypothetical protein [Bacillus infantis]|uniref:hypothetical protein n=1 Tax=Bacillus infantis TaxID=324767 RepID=UPI0013EB2780|nr:hypothetical protein [Bacillus infantis]
MKLTDEQMRKFQETFDLEDLESMQYALECEYGLNDITAHKLHCFIQEVKKEN